MKILCHLFSSSLLAFSELVILHAFSVHKILAIPRRRMEASPQPFQDNSGTKGTKLPSSLVRGPPSDAKPNYESINGPLGQRVDTVFLNYFRKQLATHAGFDSPFDGYAGIVDIAMKLNQRYASRVEVQDRAQQTLRALFPSWLPGSYGQLFSRPFPQFAARMNAWATWWAGTWLMGECEVNDIVITDERGVEHVGRQQGLLVKRCRFLEESGCLSVCVNSCKIPTQNFFRQDMGLPLTMEPDYDTFECQFSFGKTPTWETESMALLTPCLARCPSAGAIRERHSTRNEAAMPPIQRRQCDLMIENKSS